MRRVRGLSDRIDRRNLYRQAVTGEFPGSRRRCSLQRSLALNNYENQWFLVPVAALFLEESGAGFFMVNARSNRLKVLGRRFRSMVNNWLTI